MPPYRLQIYLDPAVREALRAVAFAEHTSLQALVTTWLIERLQMTPEGARLLEPDGASSTALTPTGQANRRKRPTP